MAAHRGLVGDESERAFRVASFRSVRWGRDNGSPVVVTCGWAASGGSLVKNGYRGSAVRSFGRGKDF